jgi:ABC-type nitrate/sulfonate/bicarbonate transport system substrate-binding protein
MALKRRAKVVIGTVAVVVVAVAGIVAGTLVISAQRVPDNEVVVTEVLNEETGEIEKKELVELRTRTRTDCSITPYLIAEELGFLEEEGLKLVFTGTVEAGQDLASVVSGDNDVDDAHPNALAMYVKGGAPVKGVVRFGVEPLEEADADYRHMRYYVAADSPLQTWEDLADYKESEQILINAFVPSCMTFVPSQIFDYHNLDRNRINYVTFASDQDALQAMSLGNIDIAQVHPPFYRLAEESGYRRLGDSSDAGLDEISGTGVYFFSNDYIEKYPERVQGWVNALVKTQIWLNDPANREQAAAITAEALNVDAVATHYYAESTFIPEEDLQPWIDDLVKGGYLEEGEIKPEDIVTHEFFNPSIG